MATTVAGPDMWSTDKGSQRTLAIEKIGNAAASAINLLRNSRPQAGGSLQLSCSERLTRATTRCSAIRPTNDARRLFSTHVSAKAQRPTVRRRTTIPRYQSKADLG